MSKTTTHKRVSPGNGSVAKTGYTIPQFKPPKYGPCHESHPELNLGGGVFLGASCIHPVAGYDIYVGLDWGMKRLFRDYPWNAPKQTAIEIYFPITDGKAPDDRKEFVKMVDWLSEQLKLGKKIHAGCIGGHGRTGVLLAALVCKVTGNPDAGSWVRQHYCKDAIETKVQMDFLHSAYGITKIPSSRDFGGDGEMLDKRDPAASSAVVLTRWAPLKGHRSMWSSIVEYISS